MSDKSEQDKQDKKDIFIKNWACGPLGVNCYLIGSLPENDFVLIDPGGCHGEVVQFIESHSFKPKLIIATHGHLDHIMAIPVMRKRWGIEVACHTKDIPFFNMPDPFLEGFLGEGFEPFNPDVGLEDGDKIKIGPYVIEVIHTPGHTPGSICLLILPYLFSGDTLFNAGIGRTDLPGGDYSALVHSMRERLWPLPDELILLPGHGNPSRLGVEKKGLFFNK
ncbi:MBL fold metallo-hydrolase [bacterium]|nr:MBL fold metallo-hydrolase [bacterium]